MRSGDRVRIDVPGLGQTWGVVIAVLDRDGARVHVEIGSGSMILPGQYVIPSLSGVEALARYTSGHSNTTGREARGDTS